MLIESLKNFTTDYCLEIAGEGPEYSALDDLINQYGLQNKCKLVGVRNNTINFFAGADLIVIPSRSEGIPNTLFEAKNEAELSALLIKLINNKNNEYQDLCVKAYEHKSVSWETTVDNLYQSDIFLR